ncbi:hypothetical protein GS896_25580 [Rhodococcus hoagii]|nr:hypothetical protein [Prescottella equi]MBM4719598.1 hypothetical protein [Prescottella equi]NKT55993.1 hypothetical protein [Prescottella equi]
MAVAGDWHGSAGWGRRVVEDVAARGVRRLFHVGDFRIWASTLGTAFLRDVDAACVEHDVTVYVTPGNHEWWPAIIGAPVEARDDVGAIAWFGERVAVVPRGHRFEVAGRSFLSVGGAPSIDFEDLVPGADWWPEEMITPTDVHRAIAGGSVDILLTHDSPDAPWQVPAVAKICESNPGGWSNRARAYATIGRRRLSAVVVAVEPQLLVHGHYHLAGETVVELPGTACRIVALDREWSSGNTAFVDLPTLSVRRSW